MLAVSGIHKSTMRKALYTSLLFVVVVSLLYFYINQTAQGNLVGPGVQIKASDILVQSTNQIYTFSNPTNTTVYSTTTTKRVQKDYYKYEYDDLQWKSVDRENNTRLFSAYLYEQNRGHSTVMLFGLHNHTVPEQSFYCVFQYPNSTTNLCSKHSAKQIYLNKGDEKQGKNSWAFRLSCTLPEFDQIPTYVGVYRDEKCPPPNIKWIPISKMKSDDFVQFGVCIETPIFGSSLSISTLIEGIERNLALGAEWITVYVQDDQPDKMKILRDYEKKGVLEIVEWNLSKQDAKNSHYYAESVSINDCLYRNMLRAKYLVFTDIDEIVVPQKHKNWSKMMAAIDKDNTSAYIFNHASCMGANKESWENYLKNWTCDGKKITDYPIPLYIQHNYRTPPYPYHKDIKAFRQKTIVKPTFSTTMGIHTSHKLLNGTTAKKVPSEIGILNHYRNPPLCDKCKEFLLPDERLSYLAPELFTRIRSKICQT